MLARCRRIHRAISPETVFIISSGAWKLGGFGFAISAYQVSRDTSTFQAFHFPEYDVEDAVIPLQPSLDYTAPELVRSKMPKLLVVHLIYSVLDALPTIWLLADLFWNAATMLECIQVLFFRDDTRLRALRFLDHMLERDNMQKSEFLRALLEGSICVMVGGQRALQVLLDYFIDGRVGHRVDYSSTLSDEGLLPRGKFHPLAALHGSPKSQKAFMADIASLVWSATGALFSPALRIPALFVVELERQITEFCHNCQDAGLYDKSVEIQKRVGAFAMALKTVNNCLSEAIGALARGRADGDSRTAGLIYSGNDILEAYKCFHFYFSSCGNCTGLGSNIVSPCSLQYFRRCLQCFGNGNYHQG